MNTAMLIMSIQHQLVLAISNDVDLKKVLHQFLRACSTRLMATNSHIFLFQDVESTPIIRSKGSIQGKLAHYLSLPKKSHGVSWQQNKALATLVGQFQKTQFTHDMIKVESLFYHCFKIENIGILTIERQQPLDKTVQKALLPVLQKLASSCAASIDHQILLREIKTRKEVEEKIRYQASHDFLTGLCNRMEMQRQLRKSVERCQRETKTGALLLINLVNFSNINDVMGHDVGDKVLCQIADRLKNIAPSKCTVARFSGDNFMLLLPGMPINSTKVQDIIDALIKNIIQSIELPFEVLEGTFSLSCFVSYEAFSNDKTAVHDIIKHVGIAMHEAVKHGKNKSVAYNSEMSVLLNEYISYTQEIENALKNNEFELHYQPQYDHIGNIIGAEALLRWNNPRRGYESPAIYIPIAEESDLIVCIGNFVLAQACDDITKLTQQQLPASFKQVSVNVSAKQLSRSDFVDTVISAIKKSNIEPSRLKIEITESIMMGDIELSISYLEKLRQYGVECAIDDFGTGYSSLAYLKRLPASLLKIDRVFVTNIHKDDGNSAIAQMIIQLSKRLNMDVIAEGVENKEELDCLIKLGCYQYQGYYFSQPLPFKELQNILIK